MRKILLAPLLLGLISCSNTSGINEVVDEKCFEDKNYIECIKKKLAPEEEALLLEIRKLPARMTRTSLRDFQENVRDFIDAVSLAKYAVPDSELVLRAEKLLLAFDILYEQWQRKIEISSKGNVWSNEKNQKVKKQLDFLFSGNTIENRCVYVEWKSFIRSVSEEYGEPIFLNVFLVVKTAAEQLARDGYFSFPSQNEPALIPAGTDPIRDVNTGAVLGTSQKPCEIIKNE